MPRTNIVSVLFLSAFLGFAPVIFYSWFFFLRRSKKFQRGKQPTALLSLMFLGGIAAVVFSYFAERFLIGYLPPEFAYCVSNSPLCQTDNAFTIWILAVATFAIVGPIEEGFKFLAVYFISYRSATFTRIIDGAKFGVATALGFASAENALYLFSSLRVLDLNSFVSTFLLRFALSTLAHTLYSGIFGYYLGKAQFQRYGRWRLISVGLFLAIFTHGLFDFVLFSQVGFYAIIVLVLLFIALYVRFKSPENFAVRIPEFMRRKPLSASGVYQIPVERELQSAYAGMGTILAEIPKELQPITPQQIRPEYLPAEVPSEFAAIPDEEKIKRELKVPKGTVPARNFSPETQNIRIQNARATRRIIRVTPVRVPSRPPTPIVTPQPEVRFTRQNARDIVDSSVSDIKRKRLQVLPPVQPPVTI
jgi:RsiW-degrading membrane proteinase PrsW (M82 family)